VANSITDPQDPGYCFVCMGECVAPDDHDVEQLRRRAQIRVNEAAAQRAVLEARHGQVWDTDEMDRDFEGLQFQAPYFVVRRKADGVLGSLMFQHHPRLYFAFKPHEE
jgi:hypothetical protein